MLTKAMQMKNEFIRLWEEYALWIQAERVAEVWRLNDERNKRAK